MIIYSKWGGIIVVTGFSIWIGYGYIKDIIIQESVDMITKTIKKNKIRTEINTLSKFLVMELSKDPLVVKDIELSLEHIIETPEFKERITKLFIKLYEDDVFLAKTQNFLLAIISDPRIKDQLTKTLQGSANDLLVNETLKKKTQDALWSVVKSTITPKMFRSNDTPKIYSSE